MTGAHAPDDVKVHIYVEPLSTPADQAFKEAREDDDADDATWTPSPVWLWRKESQSPTWVWR